MSPTEENTSQRRRRRVRFGKHRSGEEEREPLAAIPESTMENSEYNDLLDFKGVKYLARTWSAPTKDNALIWYCISKNSVAYLVRRYFSILLKMPIINK